MSGCAFITWAGARRFVAVGDLVRWSFDEHLAVPARVRMARIIEVETLVTGVSPILVVHGIRSRELHNNSARNFYSWGDGEWRAGAAQLLPWTL